MTAREGAQDTGSWDIGPGSEELRTDRFAITRYPCRKPGEQSFEDYFVHEPSDSVLCVPVTEDGRVVLERQYRFAIRSISLDYPSGSVEPADADNEAATIRELREETGMVASSLEHLVSVNKDPGFSAGVMHMYLARGIALHVDSPLWSEDGIEIVLLTPQQLLDEVASGGLSCALCLAATLRAAQVLGWNVRR